MNSKEKPEALQWEAKFRFSTNQRTYECKICIGPFPNLRELVIWRNEYFRCLFSFLRQRKGIKIFLCGEKKEEFQKTKTLPLAYKESREVARNFMISVSRKLMHLVESQAA
jgi:ADP-heptose:LPS heptosyltransferase